MKEALDAAQRRDEDEKAAKIARDEAREGEEIQTRLSKEADEAIERRAKEEIEANLAIEKARAIEAEKDAKQEDTASESDAFTFFGNLFGGAEKTLKPPRQSRSTIVIRSAVPEEKPEKDWTSSVFDFFGGSKAEEEENARGRGTIRIEEEKKRSEFEFYGSTDEIKKQREPGRGTIRLNEEETPSNFSFFSGSSASKLTDEKVERIDSEETPSGLFFFGGTEEKGREESIDAVSCTLFTFAYTYPLDRRTYSHFSLSFSIIERRRKSQSRLRKRKPPKQENAATSMRREQPLPLNESKQWRKRRRNLKLRWQRLPSDVSNKLKVTSRVVLCRRFWEAAQRILRRHQSRHFLPAQLLKRLMRK